MGRKREDEGMERRVRARERKGKGDRRPRGRRSKKRRTE